jgi:hypothetical protein
MYNTLLLIVEFFSRQTNGEGISFGEEKKGKKKMENVFFFRTDLGVVFFFLEGKKKKT